MTPGIDRLRAVAVLFVSLTALTLPVQAIEGRAQGVGLEPGDIDLVKPPVRSGFAEETIYSLYIDRFENGDSGNDTGGNVSPNPLEHGFLVTDKRYYHGGDIAGLVARLDYLQDLGVSAVSITPPFLNRWVQGDGTLGGSSAGYHGTWPLDFTQTDSHLGTNAELQSLITAIHGRGMKIYFDIVTNHTADVIRYVGGSTSYRNKIDFPYKTSNGTPFDDRDYVGTGTFPPLDAAVSFPYVPTFPRARDVFAKTPAWLNDVILYHNRGDAASSGESALYGDLFGLDDLFTEHPDVETGMNVLYKSWITEFGIDGYRVGHVAQVNDEFWDLFVPEILAHGVAMGRPDFVVVGDVSSNDVLDLSRYTTQLPFSSIMDRGFEDAVRRYAAAGDPSDGLRDLFDQDDNYTDDDSNAHGLIKLVGDQVDGRLGRAIDVANPGAPDAERQARTELAHALIFFSRGVPRIYYGDEQGFVGDGGGADAHQDMFPSSVPSYNDDDLIGTGETCADDNFDATHPLYSVLSDLDALRDAFPGLKRGAQIYRYSQATSGIYAFSRIERAEQLEYLVVVNNSESATMATFATDSPSNTFNESYPGGGSALTSDAGGVVTVNLPALSYRLYRAQSVIPASASAPGITVSKPANGSQVAGRVEVRADLDRAMFAEITFAVAINGAPFDVIGTDDNAPYRVYYDVSTLPLGTSLRFKAIVNDLDGHYNADDVTVTTGTLVSIEGVDAGHPFALHNVIPNPFNPHTTLSFEMARPGHVRLAVYDVSGRLVATLIDEHRPAGQNVAVWKGKDDSDQSVASGVYLYRLVSGSTEQTGRMVLLK